VAIAGGLDRLVIMKSDPARELCFRITLVSPSASPPMLPIELPDTWRVESAVLLPTAVCEPRATPAGFVRATGGSGRVSWSGFCPRTLDVDVTLTFAPGDRIPASERLLSPALRVTGC
jgi:hypothetical protein